MMALVRKNPLKTPYYFERKNEYGNFPFYRWSLERA